MNSYQIIQTTLKLQERMNGVSKFFRQHSYSLQKTEAIAKDN